MLEFLFKNHSIITHSIEALAAVVGVFCLKKYKGTAATCFILILVYLFTVDTLGLYPKLYNSFKLLKPVQDSIFRNNHWWFTIFFDIIAVFLISILYQKILKNRAHSLIIRYASICYLVFAFFVVISNTDLLFKGSYPILYIVQTILIISCASFYFIEVMKEESILFFYKSLYFYVSLAIFLWWLIITPLVFYDKYFILEDKSYIILKRSIYIFANIFMYTTFIVGLLVSKPDKST